MKVVDKEQERNEYENTPEGKRKKKMGGLLKVLAVVAIVVAAYVMNHNPMFIGKPHTVQLGDVTIIPGETTVKDLSQHGFMISDFSSRKTRVIDGEVVTGYEEFFPLSTPVDKKSYYDMLRLIKDGQGYAYLSVVNESKSKKTLGDCKIRSITVYVSDYESDQASIDGVAMGALNVDVLTKASGKEGKAYESTDSDGRKELETRWNKGNYGMILTQKDGEVYSFSSKYEKK